MAGDDQPGVAIGTPRADLSLFDDDDLTPSFEQIMGGADTDHTPTDDQNIRFAFHRASLLSLWKRDPFRGPGSDSIIRITEKPRSCALILG